LVDLNGGTPTVIHAEWNPAIAFARDTVTRADASGNKE
jgi:hypothetical protein